MEPPSTPQSRGSSPAASASSTSSLVHVSQPPTPHPSDLDALKLSRCHTCLTPLTTSSTHLLSANHSLGAGDTHLDAPRCSLCFELAQSFDHFRRAMLTEEEARQLFSMLEMGVASVRERKEKEEDVLLKGVLESLDEEVDKLRGMLEVCRPPGGGNGREEEKEKEKQERKEKKRGSVVGARDIALGRFGEYWTSGDGFCADGGEGVSER